MLGPHRVRFVLDEPFAPLLSNLAYPAGFIVSPAAVRKWGKAYGRHPAGTGPFRFVRWDSRRRIVLERYDDYAGPKPRLKRVVFAPIPDANTRVAAFLAGEIDVLLGAPPDVIAALRERTGNMAAGPLWWTPTIEGLYNFPYTVNHHEHIDDDAWHAGLPADIVTDIRRSLEHPERIGYLHLKQVDTDLLFDVLKNDVPFATAVSQGIMTEPPHGTPELAPIIEAVARINPEIFGIVIDGPLVLVDFTQNAVDPGDPISEQVCGS